MNVEPEAPGIPASRAVGPQRPDPRTHALLVVRAVLLRPALWPTAVRSVVRLARTGWWRSWPPVPFPGAAYWAFRLETAMGGEVHAAAAPPNSGISGVPPDAVGQLGVEDVRDYLRWCRGWDRLSR